jgi:chromate reductase
VNHVARQGADEPATEILVMSGSLRRGSYNTRVARAALELAPSGTTLRYYRGLREIPPYDKDDDGPVPPPSVAGLRECVRDADGLLIVTPEYNYGVPGQLKNALDWLSRPDGGSPLKGKPVALAGASITAFGTVRAQLALRQILLWTDSPVVTKPEVYLSSVPELFDSAGEFADPGARALLADLVLALTELIGKVTR